MSPLDEKKLKLVITNFVKMQVNEKATHLELATLEDVRINYNSIYVVNGNIDQTVANIINSINNFNAQGVSLVCDEDAFNLSLFLSNNIELTLRNASKSIIESDKCYSDILIGEDSEAITEIRTDSIKGSVKKL